MVIGMKPNNRKEGQVVEFSEHREDADHKSPPFWSLADLWPFVLAVLLIGGFWFTGGVGRF